MRLQVEYVMMAPKNPAAFQKMSFVVCHDHSCLKDGKFNVFFSSFLPFYIFFLPQDWFAFTGNGSQLNFTITGKEYFANSGNPSAQNNYGFCQVKTTLFQHLAQLFVRLKLPVNLSNSNSFNNSVLHSYLVGNWLPK